MPDRNNSLAEAVAEAMKRHQHNELEAKKTQKKLSLIQQIAAQAEQMQKAHDAPDDKDGK